MNNDITLEELLVACLDGEIKDAPRSVPKTPECPSFREFEAHAKGTCFLSPDAMRHVNRCTDYCQPVLDKFRQQCGYSCSQLHFEPAADQQLAAHGTVGAPYMYSAPIESFQGVRSGQAMIVVTDGPFLTEDHHLVFRMSLTEPRFQPELLPVRISMADLAGNGQAFTFDLPTQANEIVKLKLPEEFSREQRWKEIDTTAKLPFSFVVCTLGHAELVS